MRLLDRYGLYCQTLARDLLFRCILFMLASGVAQLSWARMISGSIAADQLSDVVINGLTRHPFGMIALVLFGVFMGSPLCGLLLVWQRHFATGNPLVFLFGYVYYLGMLLPLSMWPLMMALSRLSVEHMMP